MNLETARQEFAKLQKKIASMNYAIDLLFFDGEIAAPPKSVSNRIFTLEILNDELYSLKFGKKTYELMEFLLENKNELTLVEQRSLDVLKREYDRTNIISREEYIKYQSLLATAANAWHSANEENDYEIFRPHLENVFKTVRNFAAAYDSQIHPYDYCLEYFEPGSSIKMYDEIFDGVSKEVVPLLRAIKEAPQIDDSCLMGDYSVAKQEALAEYIMKIIGLDMNHVGFYTAEHPFTKRMGSHLDQRITTKYSRKDFTFSLYTILFGCGYTLAEMGQEDNVVYTLADGSASMGIMEAQTRFYEHIVGRSKPFISYIYPKLKELFPTSIKESTAEDLYLAVNKVSAGPIRAGSDEVTNNLHVLIRYELEKALMNKELSFRELPDAWAEKYRDYLGVEVTDDNHGVLQDMLWADAAIGYFPTAVLGNAYSALMLKRMSKDVDIFECGRKGDFATVNQWLRDRVWKHIGLYDSYTVMQKYLGVTVLDGKTYLNYLKEKYSEIYHL